MQEEIIKNEVTLSQVKTRCDRILRHFGAISQINKCIEELDELQVELTRRKINKEAIQTEVADVLIMTVQMAMLFGWDEVVKEIQFKLKRTERIIECKLGEVLCSRDIDLTTGG